MGVVATADGEQKLTMYTGHLGAEALSLVTGIAGAKGCKEEAINVFILCLEESQFTRRKSRCYHRRNTES